jgi:hypothetical protein
VCFAAPVLYLHSPIRPHPTDFKATQEERLTFVMGSLVVRARFLLVLSLLFAAANQLSQ